MKIPSILAVGAITLAMASGASAQTVINITGSTAFRSACYATLQALSTDENYAYTGADLASSNAAIFKGTYPNISGQTIIRCNFLGSAGGIQSLNGNLNVNFLPTTTPVSNTATAQAVNDPAKAQFAFSDVAQASTIFTSFPLVATPVGVVPFVFVANQGAPAGMDTMTDQLFQALWSLGSAPLSAFTGLPGDNTTFVYPTGRSSSSGTRISTLAETGYGVFKGVNQYNFATSGTEPLTFAISQLNFLGNGGLAAADIATALGGTSTSVSVDGGAPTTAYLVAYLGTADGDSAEAKGAKILKYNGVAYSEENVYNGKYTFWGYEQFYDRGGLTSNETAFKTSLTGAIGNNLGDAGLKTSNLKVTRSGGDGGPVTPN